MIQYTFELHNTDILSCYSLFSLYKNNRVNEYKNYLIVEEEFLRIFKNLIADQKIEDLRIIEIFPLITEENNFANDNNQKKFVLQDMLCEYDSICRYNYKGREGCTIGSQEELLCLVQAALRGLIVLTIKSVDKNKFISIESGGWRSFCGSFLQINYNKNVNLNFLGKTFLDIDIDANCTFNVDSYLRLKNKKNAMLLKLIQNYPNTYNLKN
jgi:hypothetical protein